jgi:hypothetical protein
MDTLLTLVIALGGIATGVGAIWTAMLARRQLDEQRQFLGEQNDRARLTLEFDLITRLGGRLGSPHFLSRRRRAAKHVIDAFFVDDHTVGVGRFNRATTDVANFFEEVGYFQRRGVLEAESVWHTFGVPARVYWSVFGPTVHKMREVENDPTVYEDFERLDRLVADINKEQGIPVPTGERLRRIMEDETTVGEESPERG